MGFKGFFGVLGKEIRVPQTLWLPLAIARKGDHNPDGKHNFLESVIAPHSLRCKIGNHLEMAEQK